LLEKKISRKSYDRFTELYKDIRITAVPGQKKGIRKRVKSWYTGRQEGLFHVLLIVCLIVAVLALISLISQLLFGEIPWLRILFNGFKTIGTESLVQ
jgi:hypothetical protein